MNRARFVAAGFVAVLVLATLPPTLANDTAARILLQDSPLAGFRHHAADGLWETLAVGDRLLLVREPDNPHDRNAIRVDWQGHKLGYVPRRENAALAWALDRGERVTARIARLVVHPDPRQRLRFEVFAAPDDDVRGAPGR
jgi:hypothetical protein